MIFVPIRTGSLLLLFSFVFKSKIFMNRPNERFNSGLIQKGVFKQDHEEVFLENINGLMSLITTLGKIRSQMSCVQVISDL